MYETFVESLLLPAVGIFTPSKFPRLASRMRRFDRLTPGQVQRRQWALLRHLLKDAYNRVPFYRERFDSAGLHPDNELTPDDLEKLPPLCRQEIAASFPDRITAVGVDRTNWRFAATSGTTSQRMIVLQDFAKREAVRAAVVRSFKFSGRRLGSPYLEIPPDVCNVQCGLNREPEPPLFQYLKRLRLRSLRDLETWSTIRGLVERTSGASPGLARLLRPRGTCQTGEILDGYIRQIRSYRPALLKALPTYLLALARHIRCNSIEPPEVGEIRPMGSALAPSARLTIADAFRSQVLEDYRSAELGSIGCECSSGSGLHLFADLFFIEIVRGGVPRWPGRGRPSSGHGSHKPSDAADTLRHRRRRRDRHGAMLLRSRNHAVQGSRPRAGYARHTVGDASSPITRSRTFCTAIRGWTGSSSCNSLSSDLTCKSLTMAGPSSRSMLCRRTWAPFSVAGPGSRPAWCGRSLRRPGRISASSSPLATTNYDQQGDCCRRHPG